MVPRQGRQGQSSSSSSFSTRHQEAWSWPGSAPHSGHGLESALSRSSSKEGSLERLRARASSKRRCRPFFTGHSRLTSCPASECIAALPSGRWGSRATWLRCVGDLHRALVEVRRRLPDLPPVLRRLRRRRRRRSRGDPAPPRPPGLAGGRRHLALAVLPLAHGRLRLRRQRLLRRRPAVRHPGRLRPPPGRRPRPRACGWSSTGCRTTPPTEHPWFVASRSSRDGPEAGLVRLARPRPRRRPAQQLAPGVPRRRRPGPSTRPPASTTSTCSSPSSPT